MPPVEQSGRAADSRGHGTEAGPGQLERWTRVKALFLEALEYPDSERSAFVARASDYPLLFLRDAREMNGFIVAAVDAGLFRIDSNRVN